jgi:hypothetical protein
MYQEVRSLQEAWAIISTKTSLTMPCCSQGEGQKGSREADPCYYPKRKGQNLLEVHQLRSWQTKQWSLL